MNMATAYSSLTCKYPGCTKPRYRESYGLTHDFCGRTHAQMYQRSVVHPPPATKTYYAAGPTKKPVVAKPPPSSSRQPIRNYFSNNEIKFYNHDDPYYEFTNFYPAIVTIDGVKWPTTEHYFQARKFVGTPYVEMIRKFPAPRQAFQLSRDPKVSHWRRSDWDSVKDDVMLKALQHKFDQHPNLRKLLLDTGSRKLIEHTSNDSYWGDGGDGHGLNKLGQLLMKVRDTMSAKYGPAKMNSDNYKAFEQLELTLGPGESSRSVRGMASPMTSRKNYSQHQKSSLKQSSLPQRTIGNHGAFKHLESAPVPGNYSNSVRGMASPMTSRKTYNQQEQQLPKTKHTSVTSGTRSKAPSKCTIPAIKPNLSGSNPSSRSSVGSNSKSVRRRSNDSSVNYNIITGTAPSSALRKMK